MCTFIEHRNSVKVKNKKQNKKNTKKTKKEQIEH